MKTASQLQARIRRASEILDPFTSSGIGERPEGRAINEAFATLQWGLTIRDAEALIERAEALTERAATNLTQINGFSNEKGASNYWLDAVRDFWAENELELDTDEVELSVIVKWFDERRKTGIGN